MGGIPEQVQGGKPDNDDDKDCKMDQEAAERRFAELELLRRGSHSFRHWTTPCYPTRRIDPGVCLRIAMRMKLRNGVRHDIDLHQ